ncbi:hypothetical protein H0H87_006518 [Tephrocybe sp. NHM501043]|nr:hypothetical protein H0H87_006518 [Tephrocybe sp. NHM501043]
MDMISYPNNVIEGWKPNANGRVMNGQRSYSNGRSYGVMKRPALDQPLGDGVKKVRVTLPLALVTKPHASTSSLTKPFKPPFKTLFLKAANPGPLPPPPLPPPGQSEIVVMDDDDNEIEMIDASAQHGAQYQGLAPTTKEIPDISTELEVAFSGKIPMDIRMRSFNNLRRALYGILILRGNETWSTLGVPGMSLEIR